MLLPDSTMSRKMAIVPKTARPDATGQADHAALAIADRRDAVERTLDARAIVVAKVADASDDELDVRLADGRRRQDHLATTKTRGWFTAKVHHHFEKIGRRRNLLQRNVDVRRQSEPRSAPTSSMISCSIMLVLHEETASHPRRLVPNLPRHTQSGGLRVRSRNMGIR